MKIYDTQIACQQYLLKVVPRGYFFWTTGVVATREKLDRLAVRFSENYGTRLSAAERFWRKGKGLANALVVAAPLEGENWRFYLVATEGNGVVWTDEGERLKNARVTTTPVIWGKDYYMHQARRVREHGGGLHWSWWIQPELNNKLEKYLLHLAKEGNAGELETQHRLLRRRPLHSGIRSQVSNIERRSRRVWEKCWPGRPWPGSDEPLPIVAGFKV